MFFLMSLCVRNKTKNKMWFVLNVFAIRCFITYSGVQSQLIGLREERPVPIVFCHTVKA